jgi:predicted MFS family arabinose efflux permease
MLGIGQTLALASGIYLLGALGEGIAADLQTRSALVSSLLSVAMLTSALAAPVIGRWIDARGGKPVLLASSPVFAAGLCLIALAHGLMVLSVGLAVLGLGMAMGMYEVPFAILVGFYGDKARRPITAVALLGGLGSSIGWPTSLALEQIFGWRGACLAWAALHVAVFLPLNAFILPQTEGRQRHTDASHGAVRWDRRMIQLAALFACAWFVSSSMSAHLPAVLRAFGLSPAKAIAAAALVGVAAVTMRLLEFTVLRKLPPLANTRLATLLHPLGAASLLAFGGVAAPAFALGQGGGNGMLTVAKGVLPLSLYGVANYGYRSALLSTPARFAQVGGPILFGLILDRSAPAAIAASSAVCLCMFAMTFGLSHRAQDRRETPLPRPAPRPQRPGESCHSYAVYSGAQTLKAHKSSRRLP